MGATLNVPAGALYQLAKVLVDGGMELPLPSEFDTKVTKGGRHYVLCWGKAERWELILIPHIHGASVMVLLEDTLMFDTRLSVEDLAECGIGLELVVG